MPFQCQGGIGSPRIPDVGHTIISSGNEALAIRRKSNTVDSSATLKVVHIPDAAVWHSDAQRAFGLLGVGGELYRIQRQPEGTFRAAAIGIKLRLCRQRNRTRNAIGVFG